MSRVQEAIKLLHDMRKTHRMQPLGWGRMIEESFTKLFGLLESEPTETTQSIRKRFTDALAGACKSYDEDVKQLQINHIKNEYEELLQLCDIIDRLTAELKAHKTRILELEDECVVETKRATKNWVDLKAKDEEIDSLKGTIYDIGKVTMHPSILGKSLKDCLTDISYMAQQALEGDKNHAD